MSKSQKLIEIQNKYLAKNYKPLDVVLCKGEGVYVYDVEGKKYFDFLSGYSALSQGHNHPKILNALIKQAKVLCLTSRAFFNDQLGDFAKYITELLGFEEVCPMNTGAEGVETALKLARKWGYEEKKIEENKAIIVSCNGSFHGRTFGAVATSSDPDVKGGFGPDLSGVMRVDYGNIEQLEKVLKEKGKEICCFMVEPIQGEAGVKVPPEGYLAKAKKLCEEHNVLLICDEIQTGLGRTGKLMCYEYDNIKPDILILGKALGGGVLPVSAVLADTRIMKVFTPGTHGSTFGGNPLAAVVAVKALEVIKEEKLTENSFEMGEFFRSEIKKLWTGKGIITDVRGRGLLNAVEFNHDHPKMKEKKLDAYGICKMLKKKGLLAKQTHDTIIRFSPPLVMTKEQIIECIKIISSTIKEIES